MIKKAKNTAILTDDDVVQKFDPNVTIYPKSQVLEIPNSDYINTGLNLEAIRKYNLKSITIIKGRNTVVEIIKEA
jgi:hypothetical protein